MTKRSFVVGSFSDLMHCEELLRAGSKSFFAASLLLPKSIRVPVTVLYAFCRVWDDIIDFAEDKRKAIKNLSGRLDDIYAGDVSGGSVDKCFALLVQHYDIPRALPQALLEGFSWDADDRRYGSLQELEAYAARVAGTVGAMMTLVMGVRDPIALARATDLGVAMQLTNIARDIGEDAKIKRIYLPLDWLQEFDIESCDILNEMLFDSRIAIITQRLLHRAAELYRRGSTGIKLLPDDCGGAVCSASRIYESIGVEIEKIEFNSIANRAVVSSLQKIGLIFGGVFGHKFSRRDVIEMPPIEENLFLLENIMIAKNKYRGISGKIASVIDIIWRVDQSKVLSRGEINSIGRL